MALIFYFGSLGGNPAKLAGDMVLHVLLVVDSLDDVFETTSLLAGQDRVLEGADDETVAEK